MGTKRSLLWITAILTLALAAILLGLDEISAAFRRADPLTMIFLLFLQVLTLSAFAYQWFIVLRKTGDKLSPLMILAINLAGNFIESVTPSVKLGGETARVYLFRRYGSLRYEQLTGILLVLKYYSMIPFVLLSAVFAVAAYTSYNLPPVFLAALVFPLAFLLLLAWLHHRWGRNREKAAGRVGHMKAANKDGSSVKYCILLRRLLQVITNKMVSVYSFINSASAHSRNLVNTKDSAFLITISFLTWTIYPLKVYLVASMIGVQIDPATAAIVTYTAYLVSMAPVFPGGLGTFEGTMALLFSLSGSTPAEGLAVALLSRLVTYWFPLLLSGLAAACLAAADRNNLANKAAGDTNIAR